uniref:Alw26I/Eco31I/Esp3I family type II restriction endonuclease n=1 Tax=Holdemanella biformis TaxID=1735 RepID=UPI004025272D
MAKKGAQKTNLEANEIFLQYEEEIVNDPVYAGMPDLRHDDGTIQWEAPSNRGSGVFQFSHDKRYQWWINKASEVGINTSEDKWISKVAKKIHPTKLHPCKVCGRIMDIRYCYLSANFMKRVKKLPFYDEQVDMDEITHITDFIASFTDTYGDKAYDALPELLKCSQVKSIPTLPHDLSSWTDWINSEYIPKEPSMLGPGAMSNAPDRLDGFHTYDRCCRPTADKGRSKENLASYSTDRRAFENWSDGNWIQANKLMGYINSNSELKKQQCANHSTGSFHPRPCSADHIGPISLGFSHRPEFQLLCKPCNSAKNNRMYYSDVQHLISVEEGGSTVTTWYAAPIWQRCKQKVYDKESALKLSRIMRDNRNIAMMLLADFVKHDEFLFLLTLLNLNYADYDYEIDPATLNVNNQIVTVQFISKPSTLRYVNIQKIRKIRVAFSSLIDYANKENRNGFMYTNDEIEHLKQQAFSTLSSVNTFLSNKNKDLKSAISNEATTDTDLEIFLQNIDYTELLDVPQFKDVKNLLVKIMSIVADALCMRQIEPILKQRSLCEIIEPQGGRIFMPGTSKV